MAAEPAEYDPALQLMQARLLVAPAVVEYSPALQPVHAVEPCSDHDPTKHCPQYATTEAPVTSEAVPAGQLRQTAALFAPVEVEYVPAEQP